MITAAAKELGYRYLMRETAVPRNRWKLTGKWGPHPISYPVAPPSVRDDPVAERERVVLVARNLIGLPYRHHHIPDFVGANGSRGLDCSNFTAWVYNFALGIRFSSNVHRQAETAGRRLECDEPLLPGDLIFIHPLDSDRIVSHVAMITEPGDAMGCDLQPSSSSSITRIIDSHGEGVSEHELNAWYIKHFSHARRLIEKNDESTPLP